MIISAIIRRYAATLLLAAIVSSVASEPFPSRRDPLLWPFSQNSIWNMPIGSDAVYVPQPIDPAHIDGIMVDLDIIIMTPNAPMMDVFGTNYRWDSETNPTTRCIKSSDTPYMQLPIPLGYVTRFFGTRPNNPMATLKSDGRTIAQGQPFQVCEGGYATNGLRYSRDELLMTDDVDIYSEGLYGMHGGSGLSTLGGAIRVGELSPGAGPIRHTLKISVPGAHYLYYDHASDIGYRWPARKDDTNAATAYTGSLPDAKQGCLRAIKSDVAVDELGLETEPGRKIAWTLQNYGAYQVEGVPWARMMIAAEDGPAGCVPDQFKDEWGYDFVTQDKTGNPFFRDMVRLMPLLHVVANNDEQHVGGGGTPLQPLAPEFQSTPVEMGRTGRMPAQSHLHSGDRCFDVLGREIRMSATSPGRARGVQITVTKGTTARSVTVQR